MARNLVLTFFIVLALSACKKKYYPNDEVVTTGEVIAFSGTMGGKEVSLRVGSNNYYCFTGIQHRADSVLEFSSLLAPYDCSTCANSFKMTLSDGAVSNSGLVSNVDSTFKIGKRFLNAGLSGIPSLKFEAKSNKTIREVTWRMQNNYVSNNSTATQEILKQGYNNIQLTVLTESNCENTVESKVWVETSGSVFFAELQALPLSSNGVQFTGLPMGGTAPYSYLWKFGDGQSSTEANPIHVYEHKGNYPVQLQITDKNNHTVIANNLVVVGSDVSSCALGIEIKQLGIRSVKFNAVSLQWKDEQNNLYSTNNNVQPSSSYFEIITSKPFENNEKGERGRLLGLRFSVLLSNGTQTVQAIVDKATMAVSYK